MLQAHYINICNVEVVFHSKFMEFKAFAFVVNQNSGPLSKLNQN